MSREPTVFLHSLRSEKLKNGERAVALLWLHSIDEHSESRTAAQLAREIEEAGYPTQNVSRLRTHLERDRRTAKAGKTAFRIRITARAELDHKYGRFARSRSISQTDSVVPRELLEGTRGYIEKVVSQINASYDCGLYDCCAVMCRRLLETLIIEVFERIEEESKIKDSDGNYFMFRRLLAVAESDESIKLSRNGLQGLRDFKRLGDLSAHNRRFNARRADIDRVRDGMRVAAEELLHLSGLA